MNPISLAQLRSVVGGTPLSAMPEGEVYVRAVCTDTRRLEGGCLFVAIKGANHDAHDYVKNLKGAPEGGPVVAVLVERDLPSAELPAGVFVLKVASTRASMGKLASHVRHHFTGAVVAVGGSNGKTSTKHLIDAALRCKLTGSVSPKSFNNDIGVPLTIFNHHAGGDFLVLEMGTNHHGELKVLSDMAAPDIAVITSISHEHLEGLGDLTGVRKEEASITSGLSANGLLVVNGDDPEIVSYVASYPGKKVTFGFGSHNDLFASDVRLGADGVRFNLNGSKREVFVPLLGRHTATNALAAIAVARRLGISEDDVVAALAKATGPEMRQQLSTIAGVTVLNDAYNANPASMRAAFETMLSLPRGTSGRRIAVLGEMREMGDAAEGLHLEIGRDVPVLGLDLVVFVGGMMRLARDEAVAGGLPAARAQWFATAAEASAYVCNAAGEGDVLLLKGSRGVGLEAIAKDLSSRTTGQSGLRIA